MKSIIVIIFGIIILVSGLGGFVNIDIVNYLEISGYLGSIIIIIGIFDALGILKKKKVETSIKPDFFDQNSFMMGEITNDDWRNVDDNNRHCIVCKPPVGIYKFKLPFGRTIIFPIPFTERTKKIYIPHEVIEILDFPDYRSRKGMVYVPPYTEDALINQMTLIKEGKFSNNRLVPSEGLVILLPFTKDSISRYIKRIKKGIYYSGLNWSKERREKYLKEIEKSLMENVENANNNRTSCRAIEDYDT